MLQSVQLLVHLKLFLCAVGMHQLHSLSFVEETHHWKHASNAACALVGMPSQLEEIPSSPELSHLFVVFVDSILTAAWVPVT